MRRALAALSEEPHPVGLGEAEIILTVVDAAESQPALALSLLRLALPGDQWLDLPEGYVDPSEEAQDAIDDLLASCTDAAARDTLLAEAQRV